MRTCIPCYTGIHESCDLGRCECRDEQVPEGIKHPTLASKLESYSRWVYARIRQFNLPDEEDFEKMAGDLHGYAIRLEETPEQSARIAAA